MQSVTEVSSDEDVPRVTCNRPVIPNIPRSSKRQRADSESSNIPSPLWVAVTRHRNTPFEPSSSPPPSSPERPTHAPSEQGTTSGVSDAERSVTSTAITACERSKRIRLEHLALSHADPQAELARHIVRIAQTWSPFYKLYEALTVEPLEGKHSTHYAFKCKRCSEPARQRIGTTETGALQSHQSTCLLKLSKKSTALHEFGFTGGARMAAPEVQEHWALWVSEHAWPYSTVKDKHLPCLLHPDARRHKPAAKTLSVDIKRLYEGTQSSIKELLAATKGVFHIGLDLFQADSGFDFLGIVLFRLVAQDAEPIVIKRFVLKCLSYETSHSGEELAKSTFSVMKKFGIQDRVWGVVCDNASNNMRMMDRLGEKGLKRLSGPASRSHCMLHVLNLVAKGILRPFHNKRKQLTLLGDATESDEETSDDGGDIESQAESDGETDDDGLVPSQMLDNGDLDEVEDAEEDDKDTGFVPPEMIPGSKDELLFKRTLKVLFKVAYLARKLHYNPRAKAAFKAACVEHEQEKPHRISRDMKIRWNSTDLMLEDAYRVFDGILAFQASSKYIPRKKRLREEDQETIRYLLMMLKPLRTVSDILSQGSVPVLADVIPHFNALNHEYEQLRSDSAIPLFVRHGAHRAWGILNRYYQKTDDSELYRLGVMFHPSMRVHYLKQAGWEQEWIDTAISIAEKCWKKHYQATDDTANYQDTGPASQFTYSTFLDQMFSTTSEPRRADTSCVQEFVHGMIVVDRTKNGRPVPVNPLVWWHAQRMTGNEWDGLTQMALDILSAPATSVDVERAFSFAGSIVSKRRHSLAPYSIQATALLGSYSKAGLVKPGTLAKMLPAKAKGPSIAKGKAKAKS